MSSAELEKIPDIDMYLFTEKGLRVGISYITKRYAKGNNKPSHLSLSWIKITYMVGQ